MLLYSDVISGDEFVSDAFKIIETEYGAFEVNCSMITIKEGVDIDIGANASAEGGEEEALEEGMITVNNVVHSFRLQSTSFDKKSYASYLKSYVKKLAETIGIEAGSDEEKAFQKKANTFGKKIIAGFKDYEFYVGESMDPEGLVALLNYREDGTTPYLVFFKDGLKEIKL
ncbi:hypothetical protein HK096_000963, partial [Nowakowskiella sp. JEL0078]